MWPVQAPECSEYAPCAAFQAPIFAVFLSLLLSGCGGGGGGGSPEDVKPNAPPVDEPARDTGAIDRALPDGWETNPEVWAANPEFKGQVGLAMINAQHAYALGITGKDQIIGIIDTGLDESHAEFADKSIRLNDRSGVDNVDNNQLSHGTAVASVALGARGSGAGLHGVAFDADPAVWSLNLDNDGYLKVNDSILNNAINALESVGARIINQSWGYSSTYDETVISAQRRFLEQSFGETLNHIRRGASIHVWAAGNTGQDNPAVSSSWPLYFPETAGYSITVAALGDDGLIGRSSNRCGAARHFCLAAPGGVAVGGRAYTNLARAGGGYRTAHGTSYAAPYVSGALALMMQAFGDQLTLSEYAARLFASADKEGPYADEAIYGQGVLDVEAALQPIGDLHIPLPGGGSVKPSDSGIDGGLIPPDVIERLRNEQIILLDRLNAPFTLDLNLLPPEHFNIDLIDWLTRKQNTNNPATHPFLAEFAQAGEGRKLGGVWKVVPVALRRTETRPGRQPTGSIGFAATVRNPAGRFELGYVGEMNGLMNSEGEGALKLGASHSALFSLGRDIDLRPGFTLSLDAHFAFSRLGADSESLIRGTDPALSSAFDVALDFDHTKVQISQPTYFETGALKLARPYKKQAAGSVLFEEDKLSLRSPSRPVLFSLTHQRGVNRIGFKVEKKASVPVQYRIGWTRAF